MLVAIIIWLEVSPFDDKSCCSPFVFELSVADHDCFVVLYLPSDVSLHGVGGIVVWVPRVYIAVWYIFC